jgi:Right handed beta helix region
MKRILVIFFFFFLVVQIGLPADAQDFSPYAYDIGSPVVVDYYVDPNSGSDDHDGLSTQRAWRTVQKAWNSIPESNTLSNGYRINLLDGTYGNDELPNYWELRRGTAQFPIILRAAPGQSNVRFVRDINMANVSYFYLINVNITPSGGGDAFHCESCHHILLRGNTLNGGSTTNGAHETVKINQSQYVYLENNEIRNADDNNIDFVAVQYGHIIGNNVHEAQDWCAYVKGGSAYIRVEGNTFYNCGTGGFTVGQGSGFQFMTSPWIHFEAYDVKFINNVIHDTQGAAFGVNGGYNVLIANNTAYRVGTRDHLVEVVFGERTCDGATDGAADATCAAYNAAGGWGANRVRTTPDPIGNRNVIIANNVIYNPAGIVAAQHFAIYGPRSPSTGSNIPSPQTSDLNLSIRGNVIWNGGSGAQLGIEDSSQGCQSSNPTCHAMQLQSENLINSVEPQFVDAPHSDFRPLSAGSLLPLAGITIPGFSGGDRISGPQAPEGVLSNTFDRDLSGTVVTGIRIPGAYSSANVSVSPPQIDDSFTPTVPGGDSAPTMNGKFAVKATKKGKKTAVTVTVHVSGTTPSVSSSVFRGTKNLAAFSLSESTVGSGTFKGKTTVAAKVGSKLKVLVEGSNSVGSVSKQKSVTVK